MIRGTSLEPQIIDAADLRIAFEYCGDRWRHTVLLRGGSGWTPLLTSVEGTPAEAAPSSPAFQELRLENIESAMPGREAFRGRVVQLFGQSAKDVYSAAVEVDQEHGTIEFDVALRSKRPERLSGVGSTYRLEPGCQFSAVPNAGTIVMGGAAGDRGVMIQTFEVAGSSGARLEELLLVGGRGFRVGSLETSAAETSARPRTIRWRYRIGLAAC